MGNFVSTPSDNLPKYYSYQHTKDLIQQLNSLCKQNAQQLRFQLQVKTSGLQYNHADWKRSIVPGTVIVRTKSAIKTYNIVMNLKTIYNAHQTMKHFEKKISESKSTPSQHVTPGASEECCICMDKTPTMMLPCYHTFCTNCTQIHIILKEEKKCPLCRIEFHQDTSSFQRKIIMVVGDEDSITNDLRTMLLGYLSELNSHQVRQIEREMGQKQKQDKMKKMMQSQDL